MKKIKLANSQEEWLKDRQKGIGGSDAAAALGMSPYKSKYTLWCEKVGLIDGRIEDNEAMRLGRDLEEYVAKRFTEATGKKVKKSGFYFQHDDHEFMLANCDRLIVGEKAGLECKTANALTRTKYDKGDIPIQYYIQCLHYLAVTGFDKWYIAVLVMGKGFYWYEVERDETEIKNLIENEKSFWYMVENKLDPIVDQSESTADTLYKLYPNSDSDMFVNIPYDEDINCDRLMEIDSIMKKLKSEKDGIVNRLKSEMGVSEAAFSEGYKLTWKTVHSSRIDTDMLKKEYPDVYLEVLKTSQARRFTYKKITMED